MKFSYVSIRIIVEGHAQSNVTFQDLTLKAIKKALRYGVYVAKQTGLPVFFNVTNQDTRVVKTTVQENNTYFNEVFNATES